MNVTSGGIDDMILDQIYSARSKLAESDDLKYQAHLILDMTCKGFNTLDRSILWELYMVLPDGYHKRKVKEFYDNKFGGPVEHMPT